MDDRSSHDNKTGRGSDALERLDARVARPGSPLLRNFHSLVDEPPLPSLLKYVV